MDSAAAMMAASYGDAVALALDDHAGLARVDGQARELAAHLREAGPAAPVRW